MLLLSRDSTVTSGVCVCLSHNPSLQTGSLPLQTRSAEQSSCPSSLCKQVQELTTGCKTAQGLREVDVGG